MCMCSITPVDESQSCGILSFPFPHLHTQDAVADISANPDFTSLQTLPSGKIFLLTQFEASSPAAFYVTELSQNKLTGELTAVKSMPTNWSAPELQGLWTPCAGSVTPWGTHSGGEVYEPDGE